MVVNRLRGSSNRYVYRFAFTTPAQLETALLQSFGADGDAQRNSDQVAVFEFDSGPFIPVVEKHFEATLAQFAIQEVGRFSGRLVGIVNRQHQYVEWRNR